MDALTNYQNSQNKLEGQVKVMEHQLAALSKYLSLYHKDLPQELKKITQNYTKRITFGSKITSFSSKFTSSEDEENEKEPKSIKTQASTPNLFLKINKDEMLNAANRDKNKTSPELDKRSHFAMKKSQSVHSGLIANNLKQYPLRIGEEKGRNDYFKKDTTNTDVHEQIQQERLFEKQLKHDFDENLKRLDEKITQSTSYLDDIGILRTRRDLSLNLNKKSEERNVIKNLDDSGFVTPMSPNDRADDASVVSHPLSDCDVDIKFDGHSTKLKQIRPIGKRN